MILSFMLVGLVLDVNRVLTVMLVMAGMAVLVVRMVMMMVTMIITVSMVISDDGWWWVVVMVLEVTGSDGIDAVLKMEEVVLFGDDDVGNGDDGGDGGIKTRHRYHLQVVNNAPLPPWINATTTNKI